MSVPRLAAVLLAAAVFAVGVRWGTFAVGGSDSSCYGIQAERWAALDLQPVQPLALQAPWPDASSTFAVSGHVASRTVPGAMVPICASGLSILMALVRVVGGAQAIYLLVPLFGALLVCAVYALGERTAPRVGLASAALTAVSPVLLFQVVQPMSDVPAAAFWTLAVLLATAGTPRRTAAAGLATSVAILIRPNLLPLGLTIGIALLLGSGMSVRERVRQAAAYALGSAPGCVTVGMIQWSFYGSPFNSGYGSADALFALANVWPNLTHFLTWLWGHESPFVALAIAAPFVRRSWDVWLSAALAAVNLVCYLPYVVFEEWWYLRFLLPSLPLILLLAVITLDGVLQFSADRWTTNRKVFVNAGLMVVSLVVGIFMVRTAVDRQAFDLVALESRFVRAGRAVGGRLPANAVVLTSWESGSVTYYGRRQVVVWDQLDPGWLDRAMTFLEERGLEPYLLFERWEEPLFRRRFAGSAIASLDWPPAIEIGGQVRIYRPDDRTRYRAGESIKTEYVR